MSRWPKITQVQYSGGGKAWLVDARIQGKGERLFFKTKSEAEGQADKLRVRRQNEGKAGIQIPDKLRVEALECDEKLKGVGASLRQATEFFLKHYKPVGTSKTCNEVAAELVSAKRRAGKRESYLRALGWAYGRFNQQYGESKMSEITQSNVETWLDAQENFSLATRRAYIRDLNILFRYSVDRHYTAFNPVQGIEKPTWEEGEPEIFTVPEAEALLAAAAEKPDWKLIPILAIGLFAGLRTSEIKALDWAEIDLDERLIEVKGRKAKTRQRRLVAVEKNLLAWLKPYRAKAGPIVTGRFRERLKDVMILAQQKLREAGDERSLARWPKNGMRHSFASYHLAQHHSASLTALQLGHADSTMLFAHYRNLVKPKDAVRYWQIIPSNTRNKVVGLPGSRTRHANGKRAVMRHLTGRDSQ